VMVMRFVLRECQLPVAWVSIGAIGEMCFLTIDACQYFWQVVIVPQKGENLMRDQIMQDRHCVRLDTLLLLGPSMLGILRALANLTLSNPPTISL
jgi:hypothetical protein